MATFHIKPHTVHEGRAAVEVIGADGKLLAVVYCPDDQHIRVVSKYFRDVMTSALPYPPGVEIELDPT